MPVNIDQNQTNMKKLFFVYAALPMTVFLCTSFRKENTSQALYPELETYFESIDISKLDEAHLNSLAHIISVRAIWIMKIGT